jgi:hypothetical protein
VDEIYAEELLQKLSDLLNGNDFSFVKELEGDIVEGKTFSTRKMYIVICHLHSF